MANDVTVTVSMSVKPDKLETLLPMIPDLLKDARDRLAADVRGNVPAVARPELLERLVYVTGEQR